jgi:dolichol-phosphate mannosyltransferase
VVTARAGAPAPAGTLLIAIPTYNERDNIVDLAATLLALYPAAQLVVVDDASPDGTGDVVAARAREDARITG